MHHCSRTTTYQQLSTMPPKKAKAVNSAVSADEAIPSIPPPQIEDVATHTPPQSPNKRPTMMTQAQKQALMDNLQLESKTVFYL